MERGGSTPFNIIPIANADSTNSAGAMGHGAGTPKELCQWWTRYICPPGGSILDPFMGTGTTGLVAIKSRRTYIGIEKEEKYAKIAEERLSKEAKKKIRPTFFPELE